MCSPFGSRWDFHAVGTRPISGTMGWAINVATRAMKKPFRGDLMKGESNSLVGAGPENWLTV